MADDISFEIKGLRELQKAFEELAPKVCNKGVRDALKAGSAPIQTGMYTNAPRYAGGRDYPPVGWLASHFSTKIHISHDLVKGSAFIGPQGKIDYPMYASGAFKIVRNAKGKIFKIGRIAVATVARFLEFGTKKMSKKPFMTQSFEANKTAALERIIESLSETVKRAASS